MLSVKYVNIYLMPILISKCNKYNKYPIIYFNLSHKHFIPNIKYDQFMCEDSNLQKPRVYLRPALKGRVTKWLCGGLQIRIRGFKSLSALLFLLIFLAILCSVARCQADLLINEIMYNPASNDNYNEWIELYNPTNQSINLTGWSIVDNSGKDSIEPDFDHGNGTLVIPPHSYAVITDHGTKAYENFTIPDNIVSLYVDDKSIGNGLGNTGDKLILKNSLNETVDSVEWVINYSDVPGAPAKQIPENKTLSRYKKEGDSKNCFYEGIPTPGSKNIIIKKGKIKLNVEQTSFLIKRNETKEIILNIKNLGDFPDNITLTTCITRGWQIYLEKNKITLSSNESWNIRVNVTPCQNNSCRYGNITISVFSEIENKETDNVTLFFEILGSDLWVKKIKTYDEDKFEKNVFKQGSIIRIKAFLKNLGKKEVSNVSVNFYYDIIDEKHLIGYKYYESIGKYQKYPSVLWDTINIKPGWHTVFVVVDENNTIVEFNENNNVLNFSIEIVDTSPSLVEKQVLIPEFYYHNHPGVENEYIKIYNPTMEDIDISGWYFTNNPSACKLDQNKINFPENAVIRSKSFLVVTQNASAYRWETGETPDFEYKVDSDKNVSQMISYKKFVLSNNGEVFTLKNQYNHTIDVVIYGVNTIDIDGWDGRPINLTGEGVVLRRVLNNKGLPVDTDTYRDWINTRVYHIGQSDFKFKKIRFNGMIKTFVSPDSSFNVIVSEIQNAIRDIYLNMYEFTNVFLCDELIKALVRNVSVNILLDGSPAGGISLEEKYLTSRIGNYGGKIRFITGNPRNHVFKRYSFNHAKYMIIDNDTVVVMSCNFGEFGVPRNPSFGNREWGVVIKNETVAECFLSVFHDDWDISRCDVFSLEDMNFVIPSSFYFFERNYNGLYKPCFESNVFTGSFTVLPVFSPDNSYDTIYDLVCSANSSVYVEQLYIYKNWSSSDINPFVECLVNKSNNGVDVRVIINYNPFYSDTNENCNQTIEYLRENNVKVRYVYSNWSIFSNVHNKGVIVDNRSVLISSINWNENSVTRNREAGVIIYDERVAEYFSDVFLYDWKVHPLDRSAENYGVEEVETADYENTIYIIVIFTVTFILVAQDWRKRKWT